MAEESPEKSNGQGKHGRGSADASVQARGGGGASPRSSNRGACRRVRHRGESPSFWSLPPHRGLLCSCHAAPTPQIPRIRRSGAKDATHPLAIAHPRRALGIALSMTASSSGPLAGQSEENGVCSDVLHASTASLSEEGEDSPKVVPKELHHPIILEACDQCPAERPASIGKAGACAAFSAPAKPCKFLS